ncbi:MAG: efflux RND transporter periplasmic adaptor subunit [Zymomonas mobilis subsp. pomaceae]|uniref:Efflux transporter, RND family, MFP subunit n=1 Tax=Zymomonas mobilis subsp. pomaceae (strain ATCC 29192 / DSM 22645 / JCM 10191 / CCUG 17912 / NBRC 13757 / NCIMB 11200 / NRRL B-4491 / Barker I) TaxID=579138 RepID=F8ESM4_ZYMMT|nr:efflux RND transporter periplasmic adaptor subunit [Zymomonas mobilis]AEI37799.1 efflux transporter, RND family, MFP subunit [Zymomonas mobilis subsp. pomaceae ATCC 29192]MDX5949166.1 efflux RND transporter periplasmic adaptor subunit [Zymomonas mobilis subsp. pomaceae]GEB89802.1 MexX family efflux pump subunit [Zymomonas mobilis subsp. pomaceae]
MKQIIALLPVLAGSMLILAACHQKPKAAPPVLQDVNFIEVKTQSLTVHSDLPGRTSAYEIAEVRPQVNGIVTERYFNEGRDVKKGQALFLINPAPYKATYDANLAQLARAEAQEKTAAAKLERYKALAPIQAISRQDYDDALATQRSAKADIAQAKANVERSAVDLGYTRVTSPITGRIGRVLTTVGALVTTTQNSNMAIVTRLDPIYVDVNLPTVDFLRLRRELKAGSLKRNGNDAEVSLILDDGSTYNHKGRLALSEVNADQQTSTIIVRAVFPNPEQLLLPGMFVYGRIDEGVDPHSILIPQVALFRNNHGDPLVYIVNKEDQIEVRPIKTGEAVGNNWAVTSGLNNGDHVLITGLQKVNIGDKVHAIKASPEDSAATKKGDKA